MSGPTHDAVLDAIAASLATALPARYVQRSLVDPASETRERLEAGVLCLVAGGGGSFANYRGREGQLGTMSVSLVGFVRVPDKSLPEAVERAELALLGEMLQWVAAGDPSLGGVGLDVVYPTDWTQSRQLEHPFGWVVLGLQVKT